MAEVATVIAAHQGVEEALATLQALTAGKNDVKVMLYKVTVFKNYLRRIAQQPQILRQIGANPREHVRVNFLEV